MAARYRIGGTAADRGCRGLRTRPGGDVSEFGTVVRRTDHKPSFNPPNWLFGPAWTTLYALLAFSAWRILRQSPSPAQRSALILFWTQLVLNAAWSWLFFAPHSPLLGLIDVVPQLLLIVATMVAFGRLDRLARWCLAPLAAWVTFASALNAAIWWLNK